MSVQDNILRSVRKTPLIEVPWGAGARNFSVKVVMIDGERYTLIKGLHRFDGVVAIHVKGDMQNNQRGRDGVARALAGMAEAVLAGHVVFE